MSASVEPESADFPLPPGIAFDPVHYCAAYPDVAAHHLDPWLHYLEHGRAEGRLPCGEPEIIRASGLLDLNYYVMNSDDVRRAELDPFGHFCRHGSAEGRRPNPYFDPLWYVARYGQPRYSGALSYYFLRGEAAGHRPSLLFDPAWYRRDAGIEPGTNALAHWLAHRGTQRASPLPWFDVAHYVATSGPSLRPGRDPFGHFLATSARRDVDPSPWFDSAAYRRTRMGGIRTGEAPLFHFLRTTLASLPPAGPAAPDAPPDAPPVVPAVERGPAGLPDEAFSPEETAQRAAVRAALASPFVDDALVRASLGFRRDDDAAIAAYLAAPPLERPSLTPFLDPIWYLSRHPEIRQEEPDPLLHFLSVGIARRYDPHPLIDLAGLASRFADAFAARPADAVLAELLADPTVDPGPYFSSAHYLAGLADDAEANASPLRHYLTCGMREGRTPNRFLDLDWIRAREPKAQLSPASALRRFVLVGDLRGDPPGPDFDGLWYLSRYPDVAGNNLAALRHFLEHGDAENRQRAQLQRRLDPRLDRHAGDPMDGIARYREIGQVASMRARAASGALLDAPTGGPDQAPPPPGVTVSVLLLGPPDGMRPRAQLTEALRPATVEIVEAASGAIADAVAGLSGALVLILDRRRSIDRASLRRLIDCLLADRSVAIAGATLVGPDGRIEESGRAIDNAGSAAPTGAGCDPAMPAFRRTRDVHAVSHEAALVRREVLAPGWPGGDVHAIANLCLMAHAGGQRVLACGAAHAIRTGASAEDPDDTDLIRARRARETAERWGELLSRLNQVRVLAFYLPQYHRTAENDRWWGRGFSDWINVARAEPSYEGHYQPHVPADLGFYDLRVTSVFAEQAALAQRYGVDGFCVYGYWLDGRRLLHEPFEAMLRDRSIRFPFCIAWANENWTRRWDGGNGELLAAQSYDPATLVAIVDDVIRLSRDPRYVLVDGRPVFAVYRPLLLPDPAAFAAMCRQRFAAAGLRGVHLIAIESMEASVDGLDPGPIGFDASAEFPPQGADMLATDRPAVLKQGWSGTRLDYVRTVLAFTERPMARYPRHPAVFPSWDNTPRQPLAGLSFDGADPAVFQYYAERKLDELHRSALGGHRLLFVNAWNEWAEGAHLEPDQAFGHRWLEALHAARQARGLA